MKIFFPLLLSAAFAQAIPAQPSLDPRNGHYYELVPGNISWPDAKAAADTRVFNGRRGHLATITSSAENNFISTTFAVAGAGKFAWAAGREPLDDGVWIWNSGPELGRQFAFRDAPVAPDFFAPWGGIEPNDRQSDEDYLMINLGDTFADILHGEWADAVPIPNPFDPVLGYIVEYELDWDARLEIGRVEDGIEISFYGYAGQRYQLQSTPELSIAAGAWTVIGSPVIGSNVVVTIRQPLGTQNRFYRVELLGQ